MDRLSRSGPVGHCLVGHTVAVKLCKVNSSLRLGTPVQGFSDWTCNGTILRKYANCV
jgi:hypothetical protein